MVTIDCLAVGRIAADGLARPTPVSMDFDEGKAVAARETVVNSTDARNAVEVLARVAVWVALEAAIVGCNCE